MKMEKKNDYVLWIVVILMLISCIMIIRVYFIAKSDSGKCIKDPFVYGALKLEEEFGRSTTGNIFIEGKGTMKFNSTNTVSGDVWLSPK